MIDLTVDGSVAEAVLNAHGTTDALDEAALAERPELDDALAEAGRAGARTLDLICTAGLLSGQEAVRSGLFGRSVPWEGLLQLSRAKATAVTEGATGAFLASRELVARILDERLGLWESGAGARVGSGARPGDEPGVVGVKRSGNSPPAPPAAG